MPRASEEMQFCLARRRGCKLPPLFASSVGGRICTQMYCARPIFGFGSLCWRQSMHHISLIYMLFLG
jgi:hypothetical protein